jgi:prepilin-type N-terminal cleavage/methylation domain-containing protein
MKKATSHNGFTLIELIIVMVILGILAAVAVPRYLDSISNAEASAEDAVISAIRSGLKQAANDSLYTNGRATWPTNPFDALSEKPSGYSTSETDAAVDGEWTFSDGRITHQRADNSRYSWDYYAGVQNGDEAETGTLDGRTIIEQESEEN